jgi:Protein of unknown function (DUF5672)/Glycosyltransferase family 9 (heptosyltransferase)
MKVIKNASLVIIDCKNYGQALSALKKSMTKMAFEKVLFLTDIGIPKLPTGIEVKKIQRIKSKDEYSTFCIKSLYKYIETDYFLLIQWDSEIIDGSLWDDEWYNYDYVAPQWPFETDGLSVGCGGFSWRSRRLHEILGADDFILGTPPEDVTICRIYRRYLEKKYGMKWAPDDVAERFAFELKEPIAPAFGRHGYFHEPYKEVVVIKRLASLGDVIQTEAVLHYFHQKGYKVVLHTLPQFFNLFYSHYFKVHSPDEIDKRLLDKARVISLDMSYESIPEQLHLLSYYQMAGIEDGEIRNPKLTLPFDPKFPDYKLFRKYCVIHNDIRPQQSRNTYGINWEDVVAHLADLGFTVIQIGQGEHEVIKGATEMRNMNEPMLMRLIGGADLMVCVDSGPFNIALAMDTPTVCFFGSVNPDYIIPDRKNVTVIQNHNPEKPICRLPHCWSSTISTEGVECVETMGQVKRVVKMFQGSECVEDGPIPPCVQFTTQQVIDAINQRI